MKKIILICILAIAALLSGCAGETAVKPEASQQAAAAPPAEAVYQTAEDFVESFISFWEAGKYEKMYPMFVSSSTEKLPKEKFAYLFGKDFSNLKSVEQTYYDQKDTSTVKFSAVVKFKNGDSKRISLMEVVQKKGGWKMNSLEQYFDVIAYCGTTLNKDGCLNDYALKFSDPEWCKYAGVMFKKCYDALGVSLGISDLKEICSRYSTNVAAEAECYKALAYEDNNEFYCGVIQVAAKRFECYGNLAARAGSVSACTTLQLEQQLSERTKSFAYCVAGYVEKTGDTGKCDLITGTDTNSQQGKKACLAYG